MSEADAMDEVLSDLEEKDGVGGSGEDPLSSVRLRQRVMEEDGVVLGAGDPVLAVGTILRAFRDETDQLLTQHRESTASAVGKEAERVVEAMIDAVRQVKGEILERSTNETLAKMSEEARLVEALIEGQRSHKWWTLACTVVSALSALAVTVVVLGR